MGLNRSVDGAPLFTGKQPRTERPERRGERHYYDMTPEEMTDAMLRSKLCSWGPVRCGRCGICEYGKEYDRRVKAREAQDGKKDQDRLV